MGAEGGLLRGLGTNGQHLYEFTHSLPMLSPQEVKAICKAQEQNVVIL